MQIKIVFTTIRWFSALRWVRILRVTRIFSGRLVSEFFNICWRVLFPTIHWFLHGDFHWILFNLRLDDVFSSDRRTAFFLERFFYAQDVSVLMSFPSRSSSFCFLSGLFFVALFFYSHSRSSVNKSLVPVLFELPLANNWISFVFMAVSVVFRNWLLLFHALVAGPLQRLCFVLRRVFFCLTIDFLLFHAVVPGLLPPALFCLVQRFPSYSRPHSFVPRYIFLRVYLLFHAPFRFILPLTFFCLIARCLLLSTFFKQ